MDVKIEYGNIVDAKTEVIVNAWNRNIIPWFLLIPQGVSGAIKKKAGFKPFNELLKAGPIKLGKAKLTSSGKLNFKGIIHVAGINMFWTASEYSIRESVKSAMEIVNENKFNSIAFPVLGAGSGGFNTEKALNIMIDEFKKISSNAEIIIMIYRK